MKRSLYIFLLFSLFGSMYGQVAPGKYFVAFTDKNNSPYSIDRPWEFLSQRAIDRRTAQSIPIIENDLPVNPQYIQAVVAVGVTLLNPSKWANGMTFATTDTNLLSQIRALPFVQGILKCSGGGNSPVNKFRLEDQTIRHLSTTGNLVKSTTSYDYGPSYRQIGMLNGDKLHDQGYAGQGKVIAVLDGGFLTADVLPVFDSLRANGQILGGRDFVAPGGSVYTSSTHGMEVLSTMGGFAPGQLVGTAPKASYWLLKTEDVDSEYLIEEYNWVSGAEFADSVGADVINSSLGYTVFNDSTQNWTCADMGGNTTPSTRGANIAFSKGMVIVCSAGNSGGDPSWRCVGAPGDGFDVLAIAAVDSAENRAGFSSVGTQNIPLLKPNVAAMGQETVVAWVDGTFVTSSGTSFSSPIIAGMAATLWSSRPTLAASDIKRMIEESSSQYAHPDTLLGYGIPDFFLILGVNGKGQTADDIVRLYPNPINDQLNLEIFSPKPRVLRAELVTLEGDRVFSREEGTLRKGENHLTLPVDSSLPNGLYILKLTDVNEGNYLRAIKVLKAGK
jgi:serine protease AprX